MNWRIEYDNETGPDDGGYWETWTVTNGDMRLSTDREEDAEWLLSVLISHPQPPAAMPQTDAPQATN